MKLVVDIGNTRTKAALFDEEKLIEFATFEANIEQNISKFIGSNKVEATIVSSTKIIEYSLLHFLESISTQTIQLSHLTPLPFKICYQTPDTLGRDRIAAVAGAYFQHPQQNILIIDAGTAITYDFIDSNSNYIGGNIAPGLEMRLKSLQHFTDKLPLISANGDVPLLGYNTETAIRAGVVEGIVFEIEGYISKLKNEYGDLLIFLTGGDSFYFDKRLKNIIFADLKLVLKGLNGILQYNAK